MRMRAARMVARVVATLCLVGTFCIFAHFSSCDDRQPVIHWLAPEKRSACFELHIMVFLELCPKPAVVGKLLQHPRSAFIF
jgi:hypothetical protein